MTVFVAVNRVAEIGYRQTTALLIASMVRNGHEVALFDVADVQFQGSQTNGRFHVVAERITKSRLQDSGLGVAADFDSERLEKLARLPLNRTPCQLTSDDLIVIRTNPGRDPKRAAIHRAFIHYCCSAMLAGIRVINNPFTIPYFASKSALASVDPAYRPAMIVSEDRQRILHFIRASNTDCIVKPIVGSRGNDVIRVKHDAPGISDILDSTFDQGSITAQQFISSKEPGDKRVIVLDGKTLEIDGQLAGIHRQPPAGDFRANLHAGGTAHPLALTDIQRKAVDFAAGLLNSNGIRLAGVDLIAEKIIEFNVFSTGGLFDCQQFTGLDFSAKIVDALLTELA